MDDDASLRSKIVSSLRSEFEVLEGEDYEAAYKLLQESELDILLLACRSRRAECPECTELLDAARRQRDRHARDRAEFRREEIDGAESD